MYFCGCGRRGRTSRPRLMMARTTSSATPPKTATVRYWRRKSDIARAMLVMPFTCDQTNDNSDGPVDSGEKRRFHRRFAEVSSVSGMAPSYHRLGEVPRKRHVAFRAPDGQLYAEEAMGTEGFRGRYSILYHR